MAIARLGTGPLGSVTSGSAGTTLAIPNSTGAIIPAGTLIIVAGTWDNVASATAPTLTITTVGGTTAYNLIPAIGSGATATAGTGIWHESWYAKTTAAIAVGATIATITSNQSAVVRAAAAWGFSGTQPDYIGSSSGTASATAVPTVTTSGYTPVAGDIVIGTAGYENSVLMTGDADTSNGSWVAITGAIAPGTTQAAVSVGLQYKIVTGTGAQTYNPTGVSADSVISLVMFQPPPANPGSVALTAKGTLTVTATQAKPVSVTLIPKDFTNPAWAHDYAAEGLTRSGPTFMEEDATWDFPSDYTNSAYDLTGARLFWKITSVPDQTQDTTWYVQFGRSLTLNTNNIGWEVSGGPDADPPGLFAFYKVAGVGHVSSGVPWDPTMPYLALREASGVIYFERSATGQPNSWVTFFTSTTAIPAVNNGIVWFETSAGDSGTPLGFTRIESLNTPFVPSVTAIPKDFTNSDWSHPNAVDGYTRFGPTFIEEDANYNWPTDETLSQYDLTGQRVSWRVTSVPDLSQSTYFYMDLAGTDTLEWSIFGNPSRLTAAYARGDTWYSSSTVAWDSNKQFLSFRESGGVNYFERSISGQPGTWEPFWSSSGIQPRANSNSLTFQAYSTLATPLGHSRVESLNTSIVPSVTAIPKNFFDFDWARAGAGNTSSIRITLTSGPTPASAITNTRYSLTGARVFWRVAQNFTSGSLLCGFRADVDNYLAFNVTASTITCQKIVGGDPALNFSVAWDPAKPYLALREAAGTAYFERSAEGSGWETIASVSAPAYVGTAGNQFSFQCTAGATTGSAIVEYLNLGVQQASIALIATSTLTVAATVSGGVQLPPTFVAVSNRFTGSVADITFNLPVGYVKGDYLLAVLFKNNGGQASTNPLVAQPTAQGWTLIEDQADTGIDPAGAEVVVYGKVAASASETAPTATQASASSWSTYVLAYRGVDPYTPFVAEAGQIETGAATTTTHSAPAITNTDPLALGVFIAVSRQVPTPVSYTVFPPLTSRASFDQGLATTANLFGIIADTNGFASTGPVAYSGVTSVGTDFAAMWEGFLKPLPALTLVATSTLASTGTRVAVGTIPMVATDTLTLAAVRGPQATVGLVATSALSIGGVVVKPLIETLTDPFITLSPQWNIWSLSTSLVAGQVRMAPALHSTVYTGMERTDRYMLRGSKVWIECVSAGNQALASWEAYPLMLRDNAGTVTVQFFIGGGNISVNMTGVGSVGTIPYSPTYHRFVQVRETAGTTYFETSPDAVTWSTLHSRLTSTLPAAFNPDLVWLMASAGTWASNESSATAMVIDNLNLLPVGVTQDAIVTLTATSTLAVSAPSRVAQASVPLSGLSVLSVAGVRGAQGGSAAMTASSTLTVVAVRQQNVTVALTGVSTLTAGAVRTQQSAVPMVATSTLSLSGTAGANIVPSALGLVATSTLTLPGERQRIVSAPMTAVSTLTVVALRTQNAVVALVATSTLALAGTQTAQASVPLVSIATLTVNSTRLVQTFTPATLPGLVTWLDAPDYTTGNWPNKGAGPALTYNNSPPATVSVNQLNGLPLVRFTAGQGSVKSTWPYPVDDWTVVYLMRWLGPGLGRAFTARYPPSNLLIGTHTTGSDAAYINGVWVYGPNGAGYWPTPPGPWRMYGGDADSVSNTTGFFIDGALMGRVSAGPGNGLTNGWSISGYEASTSETLDIEVAEVLVYDHRLVDNDRQQVEAYLRLKWLTPTQRATVALTATSTLSLTGVQRPAQQAAVALSATSTLSVGVVTTLATNRTFDPSFENDAVGFPTTSGAYTGSWDYTTKYADTRSFKVLRDSSPGNLIAQTTLTSIGSGSVYRIKATPGETLTVSCQIMTDQPLWRGRVNLVSRTAAGGAVDTQTGNLYTGLPANSWQTISQMFVVSPGTDYVYIIGWAYVAGGSVVGGEQAWFDGLMVNSGPTPEPYFDGDSPGCVWDGDPNGSTSRRITGGAVTVTRFASVPLTATSTLTSTTVRTAPGAVSMTATSTLTVGGVRAAPGAVPLTSTSTLTVGAVRGVVGSVAMATTSTLVVTATRFAVLSANLALTASSTLSVVGPMVTRTSAVPLMASSFLFVVGGRERVGSVALVSRSSITIAVLLVQQARVFLYARSTLTVKAVATRGGQPKIWVEEEWTKKPVKVWDGSTWVEQPMMVWTGSEWKPLV